MTHPAWPMTLALDMDLVVGAIGVVIVVGSMIANWLKSQAEARQQQGKSSADESRPPRDLDELAQRRRAELRQQAEARRRGGAAARGSAGGGIASGGSASGGGGEPGNLTMAERIERARAKEAYRERAERLRGAGQSPGTSPTDRSAHAEGEAERAAAERRRREDLDQQQRRERELAEARRRREQAEAQARAEAQQQRRRAQQGQGGQGGARRQPRRPSASRAPQPPRRAASTVETADAMASAQEQARAAQRAAHSAGRTSAGASAPVVTTARAGLVRGRELGILLSNPGTLRQAVIFKEVFDRPLALREATRDVY